MMLKNARLPIAVKEAGRVKLTNPELAKAPASIVVTEFGIVSSFNDDASRNALSPIVLRELPNVNFSNLVHCKKASFSIVITEFGIDIAIKEDSI